MKKHLGKRLYITGIPAAGKSYLARKLTEKNGVVRIDCDPIERSVMLERREQLEAALKTNLKLNRVQVR
jgi:adenylate kinase family enzyme